jgi:hypothetical protein
MHHFVMLKFVSSKLKAKYNQDLYVSYQYQKLNLIDRNICFILIIKMRECFDILYHLEAQIKSKGEILMKVGSHHRIVYSHRNH